MAALTPVTETVATVEEAERVTDEGKACFYSLVICCFKILTIYHRPSSSDLSLRSTVPLLHHIVIHDSFQSFRKVSICFICPVLQMVACRRCTSAMCATTPAPRTSGWGTTVGFITPTSLIGELLNKKGGNAPKCKNSWQHSLWVMKSPQVLNEVLNCLI